jgi:hypothetical protein
MRPLLLPTMPEPRRAIVVEPFASTVKTEVVARPRVVGVWSDSSGMLVAVEVAAMVRRAFGEVVPMPMLPPLSTVMPVPGVPFWSVIYKLDPAANGRTMPCPPLVESTAPPLTAILPVEVKDPVRLVVPVLLIVKRVEVTLAVDEAIAKSVVVAPPTHA